MKKMTLYLPDDLKRRVEIIARQERRSEADVIRDAIAAAVAARRVSARVPLRGMSLGDPTIAERVEDLTKGFGQ